MSSATAAIPPWKQALLDRKKQKEDEEKRKKEEEDAYLKSLPAWKRAMLQKKASDKQQLVQKPKESKVSPDSSSSTKPIKPSWQKEEAVKMSNGPSLSTVAQNNTSRAISPEPGTSQQLQPKDRSSSGSSTSDSGLVSKAVNTFKDRRDSAKNTDPSPRSSSSELALKRKNSPQVNTTQVTNVETSAETSLQSMRGRSKSESCLVSSSLEDNNEVDEKLASLPAWRRELILRKRNKLKRTNTPPGSSVATDSSSSHTTNTSASLSERIDSKSKLQQEHQEQKQKQQQQQQQQQRLQQQQQQQQMMQQKQQKQQQSIVKQHHQQHQQQQQQKPPAVWNKDPETKKTKPANIKDLVPPAFKEVEPWANMSEEDPAFKALPPWKQALILRRRDDYQRRSSPEEYLRAKELAENPPEEEEETTDGPEHISTIWSPTTVADKNNLKHIPRETAQKSEDEEENIPPWKMDILRNQRLKAHLEAGRESQSTSIAHHQLPVELNSLEDEDDNDMFTNIDDMDSGSEVGDTVPGLRRQSYSSSTSSLSSSGGRSILMTKEKRKSTSSLKGQRRVSWNEDRIIEEFSYPKYDYKDYNEDLPDGVIDTTLRRTGISINDNSPSQPIHPSLRPSPSPSPTPEESIDYGGSPSGSLSSYKPSILSTFASFGDPWTSSTASYDPAPVDKKPEEKKKEEEPEEVMPAEDYSIGGWDQNPGAILW